MSGRKAILTVTSGPNDGDAVTVEQGSCRLIGRHLSESETTLMDRDGNRALDSDAVDIFNQHLKSHPVNDEAATKFSATSFERGPDIIFSDDSISRAHAMVFYDAAGAGLIDLASTNGTQVNTDRINSSILHDGDTVTIGGTDLQVRIR